MAKPKKKTTRGDSTISRNKSARHEFSIENTFEAGVALEGWEVKSIRDGRAQLKDSYVMFRNNEAWLFGAMITPLLSASTHIVPNTFRDRKLLLHRREIERLEGAVDRKGFTVVPLVMYWKNNRVKLEIGLGKGKQQHDKRATEKDRDWSRDKERLMKHSKR